jgi:hypothetical protein
MRIFDTVKMALGAIAATTGLLIATGPADAAPSRPAPPWVKEIAPGTWAAVSLNTLKDLDPARDPEANPNHPGAPPWKDSQSGVLGAWNGGAFASGYGSSGALIVAGGGHADYYGNEVYAFDLASRRWQRLTNPYASPSFPVEDGIWPDGTPSVSHTYDQVDYHPGTNSFVMMKTQHDNTGGKSSPVVAMFSLDGLKAPDSNANRDWNKRNWRLSPRNPANYTNSGGWSAYDSKRDMFWANGGSGTRAFVSFDPRPTADGGRHGRFVSYPQRAAVTDAVAAYDPVNDIVVFTTFRSSPEVRAIDLSQPGAGSDANVTLTQAGTPPERQSSHGWEWSAAQRAFVYYRRGAGVFALKQQGPDWRTAAWTWSELTSPANSVVPDGESRNGVYSKFRIASFDDAEIALVVTEVDGPVYAFRIPGADSRPGPKAPAALKAD